MKKRSIGSYVFLSLVLLIMYLPILVVIAYSFNANTARIPIEFTGWSTVWYDRLFSGRGGYGDALLLSLRIPGIWWWRIIILKTGLTPSWIIRLLKRQRGLRRAM